MSRGDTCFNFECNTRGTDIHTFGRTQTYILGTHSVACYFDCLLWYFGHWIFVGSAYVNDLGAEHTYYVVLKEFNILFRSGAAHSFRVFCIMEVSIFWLIFKMSSRDGQCC